MGNLSPDDDAAGQTELIDSEQPDPNPHGQIHISDAHGSPETLARQMRQHLAVHEAHLATTAGYHRPSVNAGGDTGQSSQGGFRGSGMQGGASGSADYQTTSADSEGDADSGGASGY